MFALLPGALLAGIGFALLGLGILLLYALPGFFLFWRMGERQLWMLAAGAALGTAGVLYLVAIIGEISSLFGIFLPLGVGFALTLFWLRVHPSVGRELQLVVEWPLVALMFFQIVLVLPVYLAVGRSDGNDLLFQAFFNADFFKHLSHTQAIANQGLPAIDLFSAGGPLNYYWLQYLIPANALKLWPGIDPVKALLAMQHYQSLSLTMLLYGLCRSFSVRPRVSAVAVGLGLTTLSLDGLGVMLYNLGNDWLEVVRQVNVESWDLGINLGFPWTGAASSLYRLYLYVPQHQLALAFFVAWLILFRTMPEFRLRAMLLLPLPGISWMTGGGALLIVLCLELSRAWNRRHYGVLLPALAAALAGVLFVFLSGQISGRVEGDPFIHRDFAVMSVPATQRLLLSAWTILSSFGLLAILGFIGASQKLIDLRESPDSRSLPLLMLVLILLLWLAASLTVDLPGLLIEVQLKASFLFLPALILGTGLLFLWRPFKGWSPILRGGLLFVFLLGLPSMVHDLIWHLRPEGQWVVRVPLADRAAMQWIKQQTPVDALFQQYPERPFLLGGREVWLPAFAGRAVAYSPRSSFVEHSKKAATDIFCIQTSVAERRRLAAQLDLDYLYLSASLQPNEYVALSAEFARTGWRTVFQLPSVSVWALR